MRNNSNNRSHRDSSSYNRSYGSTMRSSGSQTYSSASSRSRSDKDSDRLLYDARGVRVKKKGISNSFLRALLYFVLPYIIINGIIFIIVTNTPRISLKVNDTTDYVGTTVEFTVKSLLPVKEISVTNESEPIEYTRSGKTYSAQVTRNGTLVVTVESINGIRTSEYADISVLDDTPPGMDESGCSLSGEGLTFRITDNQSGVNFNSVKGTYPDGTTVYPVRIDKELGEITIPMEADSIELYFEDMAGNSRTGTVNSETIINYDDSYHDYNDIISG